ncbi:MAG: DUF4198 domain-containing protein [Planctomycetota bacterium]
MSRSPKLRRLAPLFLLALLASVAHAHDFWIAPASFRAEVGARVDVQLYVGEQLRGEPVARNPERIHSFRAHGADGTELAIPGVDGKTPAGYWKPRGAGAATIVYRSQPALLALEARKFDSYLREEGLERIVELRAQRGHASKPGRERYSRCAKSLVWVGAQPPTSAASIDTALGLPLELCVAENPYALQPGAELCVQVTFEGRPVGGVLVGCASSAAPEREVRKRSDAEGRVRLTLDREGLWLVRAVHMIPCPDTADADWESFWASVTFELPAAPASGR